MFGCDDRGAACFSATERLLARVRRRCFPSHWLRHRALLATQALCLPAFLVAKNGSKFSSEEAFLYSLHRLSYPSRLKVLQLEWQRSPSEQSLMFNEFVATVLARWGHLLRDGWPGALTPENVSRYGHCVTMLLPQWARDLLGPVLPFAFVDGTVWPICAPGGPDFMQWLFWNGKDHVHAVKWQVTELPDGMILFFDGPFNGFTHDARMMTQSKLEDRLRAALAPFDGVAEVSPAVYADKGYASNSVVLPPFKGAAVAGLPLLAQFNAEMSSHRISVGLCSRWAVVWEAERAGARCGVQEGTLPHYSSLSYATRVGHWQDEDQLGISGLRQEEQDLSQRCSGLHAPRCLADKLPHNILSVTGWVPLFLPAAVAGRVSAVG